MGGGGRSGEGQVRGSEFSNAYRNSSQSYIVSMLKIVSLARKTACKISEMAFLRLKIFLGGIAVYPSRDFNGFQTGTEIVLLTALVNVWLYVVTY